MDKPREQHWFEFLEDEDIAFVKRFILSSGSLKELAEAYRVTYPTVRLRLDRLIAKITVLDSQRIEDDYERLLRALFAEGKIDAPAFKQLLQTYQQNKQNKRGHT